MPAVDPRVYDWLQQQGFDQPGGFGSSRSVMLPGATGAPSQFQTLDNAQLRYFNDLSSYGSSGAGYITGWTDPNTGQWNPQEGTPDVYRSLGSLAELGNQYYNPDQYQAPGQSFFGGLTDWSQWRPGIEFVGGVLGGAAMGNYGPIANTLGSGVSSYQNNSGVNAGSGGNMPGGTDDLFGNLLGGLGNLSPAILAGYLGNQQRQDVMGQVGRLNTLGDSLSGTAFMNSITNPYDQQTGLGRNALMQNLQQRGVGGSSFGNQQLGNFDYQRGLGRGDLATRAQASIAGTQGQLYSDALRGIVGGNAAYNQLLGAGLGASGSLFNRGGTGGTTGNGLFDWLRNYIGGGTGGGSGPGGDPELGGQTDYVPPGEPPISEFDPSIDWGSLYG